MSNPLSTNLLPGKLDDEPVFHSNSPELVFDAGVLLSTFAPAGMRYPQAHLDFAVAGRFSLFLHHVTDSSKTVKPHTLYLGVLIGNAGDKDVVVRLINGASFTTKPDAPFMVLDSVLPNDDLRHYAGPGDRVALEMLADKDAPDQQSELMLKPGETRLLRSFMIPKGMFLTPLNGISGLFKFDSDGPVNLAVVSAFAEPHNFFSEKAPDEKRFIDILNKCDLVTPRDRKPTAPNAGGELIYGRVAGVAKGANWTGTISNYDKAVLEIQAEQSYSYPLCTLSGGTLGTEQIQSAPLLCRYDDTAYQSHGNYCVRYELTIPLHNADSVPLDVDILLQSPLKKTQSLDALKFAANPERVVFRGTVKFAWVTADGDSKTKLVHLVQKQGMEGTPLIKFALEPGTRQTVQFSFIYPPDCTPPHVLTVRAHATK